MDSSRINSFILMGIINKVGGDVFIKVLRSLYVGLKPIDLYLIKYARQNDFEEQTIILNRIKNGTKSVDSIDITLAYKLIQRCCGLDLKKLNVWTKRKASGHEQCLEHLLCKYKRIRNKFIHEYLREKINDEEFSTMLSRHTSLLINIVDKLGEKMNAAEEMVSMWKNEIVDDTQSINQQFQALKETATPQIVGRTSLKITSSLDSPFPSSSFGFAAQSDYVEQHLKCDRMYWISNLLKSVNSCDVEGIIKISEEYADFMDYLDSMDSVE